MPLTASVEFRPPRLAGDDAMYMDRHGLVSRWAQPARRGTLTNLALAFLGLTVIAALAHQFVG